MKSARPTLFALGAWAAILASSLLTVVGCAPAGYFAGGYAATLDRHSVPVEAAARMRHERHAWVHLADGRVRSGRISSAGSPGILLFRPDADPQSSSTIFGEDADAALADTLALSEIENIELPRGDYPWIGLGLGLCVDALWISALALRAHPYEPSRIVP